MTDLERLIAIEEIKRVKARYWRGVDMKDPQILRAVFTDDAEGGRIISISLLAGEQPRATAAV